MKLKRAQAYLGEKAVTIIIAIACILLLFFTAGYGYSLVFSSKNNPVAQGWTDSLTDTLENLDVGEDYFYPLLAPDGWLLVLFTQNNARKPRACDGACICICPTKTFGGYNCDKAYCRTLSKDIKYTQENSIKIPSTLTLKSIIDFFEISQSSEISKEISVAKPSGEPPSLEFPESQKTTLSNFENSINEKGYTSIIEKTAADYGIQKALIKAIMYQESRGRTTEIGSCGEIGLMQFMPGTAKMSGISPIFEDADFTSCQGTTPINYIARLKKAIEGKTIEEKEKIDGRFDPEKSIKAGAIHIKALKDTFGDNVPAIIAAYNRGAGGVKQDCPNLDIPSCSDLLPGAKQYYLLVWSFYKFFKENEASV